MYIFFNPMEICVVLWYNTINTYSDWRLARVELSITVAIQVFIMFVIIILGFIMKKCNIITKDASRQLSDILLLFVTPCVIIKAYQVPYQTDRVANLLIAFASSIVINAVCVVVSKIVFNKKDEKSIINQYCSAYSNSGFMGIPLLEAVLGSEGVFYGVAYNAIFNVFNWTHGVYLYTQDKKSLSIKNIVLNPGVLGVAIGLVLFFLRVSLPEVILAPVSYMASMNTPLAMLLLGVFLADVDFKTALKNISLYTVSFVRLILIPILAVLILQLPFIPDIVAIAVIIPAACPSATASAIFASRYNLDASYASEIVAINTIISILTLPMIVAVNSFVSMVF